MFGHLVYFSKGKCIVSKGWPVFGLTGMLSGQGLTDLIQLAQQPPLDLGKDKGDMDKSAIIFWCFWHDYKVLLQYLNCAKFY